MSTINDICNLDDLRSFLASELKRVANKETKPAEANASANLAGKILSSVKLELEYNKLLNTPPNIPFIKIVETKKQATIENKTDKTK